MRRLSLFGRRNVDDRPSTEKENKSSLVQRFSVLRTPTSAPKHQYRISVGGGANPSSASGPTATGTHAVTGSEPRFVVTPTKLGSGAYGAVLAGTAVATSADVAVKLIADGRMKATSLEREVSVLKRLSEHGHPGHLEFYGYLPPSEIKRGHLGVSSATSREPLPLNKPLSQCHAIVTEVLHGGELFEHVLKVDGLAGHEEQSAPLFAQICDAVYAAHTLGIVHRDLKLENVLLVDAIGEEKIAGEGGDGGVHRRVKLIDWGLAYPHKLQPDGTPIVEKLYSRSGSRSYMAPEVANKDISSVVGYNGFCSDVWSLGVCLFAMHLGFFPFEQANPSIDWRARRCVEAQSVGASTMATILSFYPSMGVTLSRKLLRLLDRMLIFDPKKRATLAEVLGSEWLAPYVATCCSTDRLQLSSAHALATTATGGSSSCSSVRGHSRSRSDSDSPAAEPRTSHIASPNPPPLYSPPKPPPIEEPEAAGNNSLPPTTPPKTPPKIIVEDAAVHGGHKPEGQLSPGKHGRSSHNSRSEEHASFGGALSNVSRLLSKTCKLALAGTPRRPSGSNLSALDVSSAPGTVQLDAQPVNPRVTYV